MTQRVRGRFKLVAVTPLRGGYSEKDENGVYRSKTGHMAKVELFAVTAAEDPSGMFSRSTPYGKVEMHISNPDAAKFFTDAWHAYVNDPDDRAKAPEFFVDFTPAED